MADLSGKVAVITGAASGIGAAGVEVFVEAGAQVVAADIQDEKGAALVQRFGADKVAYQNCDVMDPKSLEALMQSATDTFGGLDILWNNAGSGGTSSTVEEMDFEGYDFTMDLLLKSVFAGTHFAVPHMKARGGGSVVNTSSISAVCAGYAPVTYSVAKKADAHFSKLAAAELAKYKIRVNAILPGVVETKFAEALTEDPKVQKWMARIPAARAGQPTDMVAGVIFLVSDEAAYTTGTTLVMDGGAMLM